jgi:hypothetical protein
MSATPILDLDQPPPDPPKTMLPKLIGLAIGMVLGGILILADMGKLPDWNWPRANGLLLIPALYFAIAFHELGHLIAGKLAGFNIGGISIGPFLFSKSGRNWVFRFDRHRWLGGFFQPLSSDVDLPTSRYAVCVAGGPIASVLFTALCWLICLQYGSGYRAWIGSMFWASLFILLLAVIPINAGLEKSDGARLWQLIHYPERARAWIALLTIQSEDASGLRPRDWTPETFQRIMQVDASAGEFLYCQYRAYYRYLDEGSETRALGHLENALAKSGRAGIVWRHALFLEAASASALIRKQAAQARTWCERACKLRNPLSLEVVNAGIAMCESRYSDAVQHWEGARDYVERKRLDSGLIRFAKEKWAGYEAVSRAERL